MTNPTRSETVYDLTAYGTRRHGEVPGCNCASHGLLDGNRHGLGCPYGRGWTAAWIDENRPRPEAVQTADVVDALRLAWSCLLEVRRDFDAPINNVIAEVERVLGIQRKANPS